MTVGVNWWCKGLEVMRVTMDGHSGFTRGDLAIEMVV